MSMLCWCRNRSWIFAYNQSLRLLRLFISSLGWFGSLFIVYISILVINIIIARYLRCWAFLAHSGYIASIVMHIVPNNQRSGRTLGTIVVVCHYNLSNVPLLFATLHQLHSFIHKTLDCVVFFVWCCVRLTFCDTTQWAWWFSIHIVSFHQILFGGTTVTDLGCELHLNSWPWCCLTGVSNMWIRSTWY